MNHLVFTIDRQYGSGGHEIGEKLAHALDIPFYDSNLTTLAAQRCGVSRDVFEQFDEQPTNSFLYSLSIGAFRLGEGGMPGNIDVSVNDRLFLAQREIIEEAGRSGPCVVVGRCADFILRRQENCVRIYVYRALRQRVRRVEKLHGLTRQKAEALIQRRDKSTSSFYHYYTDQKWGDKDNYDLMINTGKTQIDQAVALLLEYQRLACK